MPDPEPQFERLIKLLAEAEADFVVIGGLAVIFHGGSHVTQDADFAISRTRENARLLTELLKPFNPAPAEWPAGLPFVWDPETILRSSILTLSTDLGRVDLLAEPPGVEYADLRSRANVVDFDGTQVWIASASDLITMKRAVGRPKDLAHIEELNTLRLLEEEGA